MERNPTPKIFGLPASMNDKIKLPQKQSMANAKTHDMKNGYFDSYSHFGIHEEMLKDSVRTESYRDAILKNKDDFKDKIVLDIGCGTGILSLFAAKAGAKHVYAIEMAEIANFAKEIVQKNGFKDKITVIKGKVEEVTLPVSKVDIIISEWMGYFLLFESMLDSVIFARDKWLKKGGLILPDKTTLFIAGIEDAEFKKEKIHFWDEVYGFDMSCLKKESLKEPLIDVAEKKAVVTTSAALLRLDLHKITVSDLTFEKSFRLMATRSDYLNAFICYFDASFSGLQNQVWFSTGPFHTPTHWKQTIFYTERDLMLTKGEYVYGKIKVGRGHENFRDTNIFIRSSYRLCDAENSQNKNSPESKEKEIVQKRWYYLR